MESVDRPTVPRWYHALAALFIACCASLALLRPEAYAALMQEDRPVEWATVPFFVAAGALILRRALRGRRAFDFLVGVFCLFVAGEEISWGQRILGVTPPAYFLEHNIQQELNLHNFSNPFGGPKWPLMLVLIGYAVVLPAAAALPRGRRLLSRLGATPPPGAVIPWFVGAVILLYWYPFRFTGEWVELLVGSAFFVSAGISTQGLLASTAAFGVASLGLSAWSARGDGEPARLACAAAEVSALAARIADGGAHPDLAERGSVHKRLWTLVKEEYLHLDSLRERLEDVRCGDEADARVRRSYLVDPWGTAYWLRTDRAGSATVATVYSFGANRRRDLDADGVNAGDDVVAHGTIAAP